MPATYRNTAGESFEAKEAVLYCLSEARKANLSPAWVAEIDAAIAAVAERGPEALEVRHLGPPRWTPAPDFLAAGRDPQRFGIPRLQEVLVYHYFQVAAAVEV